MLRNIGVLMTGLILLAGATELRTSARTAKPTIDRAVVELDEPVTMAGVVLRGRFLFLHHQGMMTRGGPCMFVYSLAPESEGTRVLAFHCIGVDREKAAEFKLMTRRVPGHPPQVIEVQFAGTTKGHQVPGYDQDHP
jgi:hypothetical protein